MDAHARPGWVYELVRLIITWIALFVYRTRAIGTANVPATGPVILAPNHFSNMDHFFAGVYTRRKIRFMAKSQLFGRTGSSTTSSEYGGVFPVRAATTTRRRSSPRNAILDRGGCVLIYAEGGRSRTGELGEAKPGVGRLALESGVPVVPVAIHGSTERARAGSGSASRRSRSSTASRSPSTASHEPTREQQLAAEQIFDRVRAMYAALEESGRASVIKSLREGAAGRRRRAPARQPHS